MDYRRYTEISCSRDKIKSICEQYGLIEAYKFIKSLRDFILEKISENRDHNSPSLIFKIKLSIPPFDENIEYKKIKENYENAMDIALQQENLIVDIFGNILDTIEDENTLYIEFFSKLYSIKINGELLHQSGIPDKRIELKSINDHNDLLQLFQNFKSEIVDAGAFQGVVYRTWNGLISAIECRL